MGHALAALLGADPKRQMDGDLVRMKTLIEIGNRPHDVAQPQHTQRHIDCNGTDIARILMND